MVTVSTYLTAHQKVGLVPTNQSLNWLAPGQVQGLRKLIPVNYGAFLRLSTSLLVYPLRYLASTIQYWPFQFMPMPTAT